MQSGLVPYAHTSHARAILSVLSIVTHSFIRHIDLCTLRVLHSSRHAGGPAPWYLSLHYRPPNARPIVQPLPHPCDLLQANWVHSHTSPARVTDGRYVSGPSAFLRSPPERCRIPGRSPSFTARRCGAVIQAEAHSSLALISSRPVFLHSPLVRCRRSGRSPSLSGRFVWRGRASRVGLPAYTRIRYL